MQSNLESQQSLNKKLENDINILNKNQSVIVLQLKKKTNNHGENKK